MPEGPEVASSVDYINKHYAGKTIIGTKSGGRYLKNPVSFAVPVAFLEAKSQGKFSWWIFDNKTNLAVTYGMSGQWFENASEEKHSAFTVFFEDGTSLSFVDPRRFGTVKVVSDKEIFDKCESLSPCVIKSNIEPIERLELALKHPYRTVAEVLMDQSVFAGVGNYIKSEALFESGILPDRQLLEIQGDEFENLTRKVEKVARSSYETSGATIKSYRKPNGEKGETQFSFKIYGKKKCPLGHKVINEKTDDDRTSWYCKECQK